MGEPPPLPELPGASGAATSTAGETTPEGGSTTLDGTDDQGLQSSSTGVDPCAGVSCSPGELCVAGECFMCPTSPSCQSCGASDTCQCPAEEPCCEVGVCIGMPCDPLLQDCDSGDACYFVMDDWSCATDASGDVGAYGDSCEFINVCDPGLVCLDASAVPGCEGAAGCCSELCDVSEPDADEGCTGVAEGQTCQPWYAPGAAPPGYDNVGVCAL